jgi:hypothetical protein
MPRKKTLEIVGWLCKDCGKEFTDKADAYGCERFHAVQRKQLKCEHQWEYDAGFSAGAGWGLIRRCNTCHLEEGRNFEIDVRTLNTAQDAFRALWEAIE